MIENEVLGSLLKTCQFISDKGFSPATAGNFSIRLNANQMFVSASGKDKNILTQHDFVTCDLNANLISGDGKPSDEAYLHGTIYQLSSTTQCVLYTHSIPVTCLSRMLDSAVVHLTGYEMIKTIAGHHSHEAILSVTIFDNHQDMACLAEQLRVHWLSIQKAHGFIVRGHGLYSWGNSVFEAKRHMEGLEFLMACEYSRTTKG